jgi:hypothetical protein
MQLTDKVNTMTLDQRQKLMGQEIAKASAALQAATIHPWDHWPLLHWFSW